MDTNPADLQRQADRLQTLNQIGRVVSATLDLDALYETIYQQVGRVMDAEQLFIALRRPDHPTLEVVYHRESGKRQPRAELPFGGNVTSLMIERGTSLLFADDAEFSAFARANNVPELTVGQADSAAKIWVPLNTGNRSIGALSVQSGRSNAYTQDDLQMLLVIASQAAVAIENARLYERSQRNVRQMKALLDVAQMLNSSLDLPTVLNSILRGMREVIPCYLAAVLLPNHRQGWLDIVGAIGPLADERRRQMKIPFGRGVTGRVFQGGRPLYVPDVTEFEDYLTHDIEEVRAEVAVPLKRGDTVVGVLDLERTDVASFSQEEIDLIMLFASQAAIAIENARLFAAQQQRVVELQTIQTIVQQLTTLHEIPPIAAAIDRELNQLIHYHACRIFVLDTETQILEPVSSSGSGDTGIRLRLGEGLAGSIAQHGQPVIIPNSLLDSRVMQIVGTPLRAESMIGTPLIYQGRVRGVLTLSRLGTDQFDENDLRLLEIIGGQAGIAFERAQLYDRLRTEAITDPLTGLYNRRFLLERFREERARAKRNRHSLTVVMLDIDKFKQVNDTYGHDAGDVVLDELGAVIRRVVRAEDLVARYGGEEFSVLLPDIPRSDAISVAERLRATISGYCLPASAGSQCITVSVGMAFLDESDEETEIFSRADRAMYEVKRAGGNRVAWWERDGVHFLDTDTGEAHPET